MTPAADTPHRPRLYSAAQVRELDRRAIAELGIPGYTLMQRAARAAFQQLQARWPRARRIAVLCGPGNNGGDGYELACLARDAGWSVELARVGPLPAASDAVQAHAAWTRGRGEVPVFCAAFAERLRDADVLCDALFGIGITRAPAGEAAQAIAAINARPRAQGALALDLPSGLDADSGAVHGSAVRADLSVSFIGRKLGLYVGAGPDHAGQRAFDALGVPDALIAASPWRADLLDVAGLAEALPPRARSAHKGTHGHVLIVGGDHGMGGAVLLAARGAQRSGAGLVSVATRTAHAQAFAAVQPEAMFHAVEEAPALDGLIARASVVAVGPGLGQSPWAHALLQRCLAGARPLLLDADALNRVAAQPGVPLPPASVITPHPGEAARLLGLSTAEVQKDRCAAARALAARGTVAVLKGAGTLIAGERLSLCPYGNPGMGVGGMGDVLSGVIAALIAQGLAPEDAACAGVLAHALAGDRAAADGGERGLLPGDLIGALRAVVNP